MSTTPQPAFKSAQYEFNDEQNKVISSLVDGMGTVALLMKLIGLAFLVFFGLLLYKAVHSTGYDAYGPVAAVGSAMLVFLSIGFWTGGAAHSFRRIVETKNEDIWHLMNALESLRNMYSLLRTLILLGL